MINIEKRYKFMRIKINKKNLQELKLKSRQLTKTKSRKLNPTQTKMIKR